MKTKKKVLICGASGFVGFNLFQNLSQIEDWGIWGTYFSNHYHRLALGRFPELVKDHFLRADLTDPNQVNNIMDRGFDVVIQAAAFSSGAKDTKTKPWIQVTPSGVINSWVLQSAFDHKVEQVIFLGSSILYPSQDEPSKETDVDENNLSEVHRYASKMKLLAEEQCRILSQYGTTKFTVIRPSNLYGPYDRFDPERSHVFAATIRKVAEAKDGDKIVVWGKGQEVRDFLYINDFVRLVKMVIDRQDYQFDIFNAATGEAVTVDELNKKVIAVSEKNLEVIYDPNGPTIGTKISMDTSKVRDKFGWEARVSLSNGITRTLEWYKSNILEKK